MTSLTEVFVRVLPDMDKFGPEVKKKLSKIDASNEGKKVAGRFGVGFNGAFGGIVKHSAGLFVGAFAVIKSAQVFGSFINDARESAKVARVSAQVIKSTGGIAGITAAQMGLLSTAISNKTGADDEAIQSGENLLATFTNVRNGVGKGNDVFNRATQAAVDMASAMNNGVVDANGLKSANIQLGKALNDPIKGVTALSKVGVSFTADQKKQIKQLTEHGHLLKAQKIILGEVGKEFGGAAAAAADPLTRLKTIAGNLSEQVGGYLLPKVDKFVTFVNDKGIPVISGLADKVAGYLGPKLKIAGGIIQTDVLPRLQQLGGFIRDQILPRLQDFAGFFVGTIIPKMKQFAGFVVNNIVPAVGNLITAFTPFVKDVGKGAVDIFQKIAPVVVTVGTAIVKNVLPAIKDFTKFLSDNKTVVTGIAVAVGAMVGAFYAYRLALTVVSIASKAFAVIQGIVNAVMSANPIGIIVLALVGLAAGLIYAYKHSDTFRAIVDKAFKVVRAAAVFLWDNYLKGMFAAFVLVLKQVWGQAQTFARIVSAAWGAIKEPARVAIKYVIDTFLNMVGTVLDGAAKAFGWVPNLGDKLKGAAKAFGTFRDDVNKKLSGIQDQTIKISPIVLAAQAQHRNAIQDRLGLAAGGEIPSTMGVRGKDSVPALLMPDEHVLTTKDVAAMGGQQAVYNFRAGLHKFANGGAVGVSSTFPNLDRSMANIASVAKAVSQPIAQALGRQFARINPGLQGVLKFVQSQVGKPYQWGAVGPGGYDCSGLVSAAINTALGRNPYQRLGATGSMPWSMFASGPGAFEVGWLQGNPGHTAATVNGTNIESAGGVGVRMGSGARGARNSLFTNHAHVKGFAAGGQVGDAPYDLLRNRKKLRENLGLGTPKVFDKGGPWKSGELGVNTSGKTETVIPGDGTLRLHPEDIRSIGKELGKNMSGGSFRLVQSGGGSYVLEKSNG